MADDLKSRLVPRVVSTPELLRLETVSRDHAFNQNLDPAWLESVISVEGHHLITPELAHPGRERGEAAHLRSLLRIQLRTDLPWTDAPAMLSLLDLPFEVFESLPEPSIGTLNWLVDLTTAGIPTQAQVAEQQERTQLQVRPHVPQVPQPIASNSSERTAYVPNALISRLVGDRLVAVSFVLDSYLQLQFDEANMNVGVWPVVTFGGRPWHASDVGYADSLRHLCGGTVVSTSEKTGDGLRIGLSTGEIHINPTLDEVYVEIALLRMHPAPGANQPGEWMCWRPGEHSFEHLG